MMIETINLRYKDLMNQVKHALAPKDGEFGIAFEWADAQVKILG